MNIAALMRMSLGTLSGFTAAAVLLVAIAGACDRAPRDNGVAAADRQPVHIDSILPIDEEIRRFRATLSDSAAALSGGAASRDELVAQFLAALEAGDRAALEALAISRTEFAYLYYPSTRFTRRPYELSPTLVWFQLENASARGLTRALQRYGGKPLPQSGYVCPGEPETEGENRIWSGCLVRTLQPSGDTANLPLFGPILFRDGRFKFISHANTL